MALPTRTIGFRCAKTKGAGYVRRSTCTYGHDNLRVDRSVSVGLTSGVVAVHRRAYLTLPFGRARQHRPHLMSDI